MNTPAATSEHPPPSTFEVQLYDLTYKCQVYSYDKSQLNRSLRNGKSQAKLTKYLVHNFSLHFKSNANISHYSKIALEEDYPSSWRDFASESLKLDWKCAQNGKGNLCMVLTTDLFDDGASWNSEIVADIKLLRDRKIPVKPELVLGAIMNGRLQRLMERSASCSDFVLSWLQVGFDVEHLRILFGTDNALDKDSILSLRDKLCSRKSIQWITSKLVLGGMATGWCTSNVVPYRIGPMTTIQIPHELHNIIQNVRLEEVVHQPKSVSTNEAADQKEVVKIGTALESDSTNEAADQKEADKIGTALESDSTNEAADQKEADKIGTALESDSTNEAADQKEADKIGTALEYGSTNEAADQKEADKIGTALESDSTNEAADQKEADKIGAALESDSTNEAADQKEVDKIGTALESDSTNEAADQKEAVKIPTQYDNMSPETREELKEVLTKMIDESKLQITHYEMVIARAQRMLQEIEEKQ